MTTLQQAARLVQDESTRALPVMEHTTGGSRAVGIVTGQNMVVHDLTSRNNYSQTTILEVMTRGLLTIHDNAMINETLRSMLSHSLHHLAMVGRQQRLVSIPSLDDTVRAMDGEWTLLVGILGRDNAGQPRRHAPPDLVL